MTDSNDYGDSDESPTEKVRLVQLLDLDPGTQGKGAAAKKIVLLRLGCGGEIEQPLGLNQWDARRLAVLLLRALDYHGDPLGEALYERAAGLSDQWQPAWLEDGDPAEVMPVEASQRSPPVALSCYFEQAIAKKRKLVGKSPTAVKVSIRLSSGDLRRVIHLHGAYSDGRNDILLFRVRTKAGVHDGLLWVDAEGRWRPENDITEDSLLPTYYWPSFFLNPDGNKLLLGDGTRWHKLSEQEFSRYGGRILEPLFRSNGQPKDRRRGG